MIRNTHRLSREAAQADAPREAQRGDPEASAQQTETRNRVLDVLNSWDRGIDRVAVRIGDSITEGAKAAWQVLRHGKTSPKNSDHTEHTAA